MFDQSVSPVADPFDISSDICQCVRMGRIETVIIGNPPVMLLPAVINNHEWRIFYPFSQFQDVIGIT